MLTVTIAAALAPHSPALQIDWNIMVYRSKTGSSPSLEIHRRVAGRQSLAKKPDGELTLETLLLQISYSFALP